VMVLAVVAYVLVAVVVAVVAAVGPSTTTGVGIALPRVSSGWRVVV